MSTPARTPAPGLLREGARPCQALVTYERTTPIKGFFGSDDAIHFSLVLGMQRAAGIKGDILEIGSWFGRSTAFLANFAGPGERLVVCDAFELETEDRYPQKPTVSILRRNLAAAAPDFDLGALVVHNCLSKDLRLAPDDRFRCAHVDGGHGHDEALADLRLVVDHIIPGGVIIVDDYLHARWPGVTSAVEQFLGERTDIEPIASCNRWQAIGQKLYLMKAPSATQKVYVPAVAHAPAEVRPTMGSSKVEAKMPEVKRRPDYNRSDEACKALIAKKLPHYHIVRLNDRVSTPGRVDRNHEFGYMGITTNDMTGKSVLDIGALDGVISFNAERAGADRVLAIDVEEYELYDWGWEGPPPQFAGLGAIKNAVFPSLSEFFGSNVERKHKTVYDLKPAEDGQFDFVFFYGVLYHLRHPLLAFDKIRAVCKGAVLVETHVCNAPSRQMPASIFYIDDVLAKAVTNWTGPTEACVVHWMRDAGFQTIYVEQKARMISRQRFIGFVSEPTFAVSEKFELCTPAYFSASRREIAEALQAGSFNRSGRKDAE